MNRFDDRAVRSLDVLCVHSRIVSAAAEASSGQHHSSFEESSARQGKPERGKPTEVASKFIEEQCAVKIDEEAAVGR